MRLGEWYTLYMKFFRAWMPAIVWMVLIFTLSARQRISVSEEYALNFLFFKTLHVIEYAIFFGWCYRGLGVFYGNTDRLRFRWAFVFAVLYAITDEIHQTFVPTREGKVRDVIIDATGAAIAWYLIAQLLPKAPKTLKQWVRKLLLQ
jgi:VanZ family protein